MMGGKGLLGVMVAVVSVGGFLFGYDTVRPLPIDARPIHRAPHPHAFVHTHNLPVRGVLPHPDLTVVLPSHPPTHTSQGVVSGGIIFLKEDWDLSSWQEEMVVSVTVLSAALGCVLSAHPAALFGRLPVLMFAAVTYTVG